MDNGDRINVKLANALTPITHVSILDRVRN
jgi:hypothetical protein